MATEMATRDAAKVALVAGKRLLASVRPLMNAEIAAPGAAKVALVTGIWLLARVRPFVATEIIALGAAIVALVAGKCLLARVRQLMATEMVAPCVAIVALVAGELSHRGRSHLWVFGWYVGFICHTATSRRGHALALVNLGGCEKSLDKVIWIITSS